MRELHIITMKLEGKTNGRVFCAVISPNRAGLIKAIENNVGDIFNLIRYCSLQLIMLMRLNLGRAVGVTLCARAHEKTALKIVAPEMSWPR